MPEMFYLDANGVKHDDGLHDAILDNPKADAAFRRRVIADVIAGGMTPEQAQKLFGPDPAATCAPIGADVTPAPRC